VIRNPKIAITRGERTVPGTTRRTASPLPAMPMIVVCPGSGHAAPTAHHRWAPRAARPASGRCHCRPPVNSRGSPQGSAAPAPATLGPRSSQRWALRPVRHDGDTSSARFAARYGALVLLGSACLRRAPIGSYGVPRSLFGSGDAIPVTCAAWVVPFCRRQSDATSEALAAVG
jgi:hypothetical protein